MAGNGLNYGSGPKSVESTANINNSIQELQEYIQSELKLRQKAEVEYQEFRLSEMRRTQEIMNKIALAQRKKEEEIKLKWKKKEEEALKKGRKADLDEIEKKKKKELEALKEIQKKKLEYATEYFKKQDEFQKKLEKNAFINSQRSEIANALGGKGQSINERWNAINKGFHDKDGNLDIGQGISNLISGLGSLAGKLEKQVDDIAKNKGFIDTALQGSRLSKKSGSYWNSMSEKVTGIAGLSSVVSQDAIVSNIKTLVGQGIAFNIEERATLMAIKDRIADTFEANSGTLRQLVRIQQEDTTAARLGMESALTSFLNNMYETSEYMRSVASGIKDTLLEAESLMGAKSAAAFEYQVQKWMGSLYSVGMNQNSVSGIASALGDLAAGKIDSLGSGASNLLIMAANSAGISIADALNGGLSDTDTNLLLSSMSEYLSNIYEETKDSKVVQQQYAKVFGLSAADLKAAASLARSNSAISKANLNYNDMLGQLSTMTNSIGKRMSVGERMLTMKDNLQYSMANGIANNPALLGIYSLANLLTDTVGGININLPFLGQMNIADTMRTGALAGGIINSLGDIMSAGNGGGFSGAGILKALGVSNEKLVSRGAEVRMMPSSSGIELSNSGQLLSTSDGSAIQSKTIADNKNTTISASGEDTVEMKDVNDNIVRIYELLMDVKSGGALRVVIDQAGTLGGL